MPNGLPYPQVNTGTVYGDGTGDKKQVPWSKGNLALQNLSQTAGEIAGNITPAQWNYLPGNVNRYAVNTTPGTTDMTAAFLASIVAGNAVTYAPASGGPYAVGSSSIVLGNGQAIVGDGPGATSIVVNSATNDVFVLSGLYTSISGLNISPAAGITRTGGRYVYGTGFGAIAYNMQISGHLTAFEFNGVSQIIDLMNIRAGASNAAISILISGGNDQYVSRIVSDGSASFLSAFGLQIVSSGGTWVSNCDFIRHINGVACNPGPGKTVEFLFFDQVASDSCSNACWALNPINGGILTSVYTNNCWGASGAVDGLQHFITGSGTLNGIHHVNFRALNNGQDGIVCSTGGETDIEFIGCRAAGNGASTYPTPTYAGLRIGANVSGVRVIGGKYGPGEGQLDTQLNQIQVDAGTSDYITILGPDVRTANNPISFNATPATNSCVIDKCQGWRTRNRVEGELLSGNSSVTVPHGLPFAPAQQGVVLGQLSNLAAAGLTNIWVASTDATNVTVQSNTNATANTFFTLDINGYPSFL